MNEEVPRDQWKRPLIIPPGGGAPVAYTRISTFAGMLDSGHALGTYFKRNVALGIGRYEDLAAIAAGCDPDEESGRAKLDMVAETAMDRVGANAKANWGTAIHGLTDPGAQPFVPERMRSDVLSYVDALDAAGIVVLEAERFVVNDALRVAGTYDGIYDVPGWGPMLGDKKTGTLHPHNVAIQLACYAGGSHYTADGTRTSIGAVRKDVALVLHIPAGRGITVLHLADIDGGFHGSRLAAEVRDYRSRNDLLRPFEPGEMPPPIPHTGDEVTLARIPKAIAEATSLDALYAIHEANAHAWTEDHTAQAVKRRAQLGV